MSKSYRIRTTPGIDKNIRIDIQQDFDLIEILSLKLKQEDVYTRFCADYGVVVGRVIANGGYGVPNVSISVFVPLTTEDENDIVISTLYPYKTVSDKNDEGYRYNLLPYVQEYGGHTPTGTFPDIEDVLNRKEVLEVYEKYYKYTVRTNESGDFMIVGVPLGIQTVVMDLDLSNIGCFSQRPSDLVRQGLGVESQFAGPNFRSSENLDSLPQIVNQAKDVEVASFWGEENICNVGITRIDFDLRDSGIEIQPQAIFMGSIFSTSEEDTLNVNCKPKFDSGNLCDLVTGAGKILALRQTVFNDSQGLPVLEEYKFQDGGNVIDDSGTWLVEVPMNFDYVSTNEFGEQIISNDPTTGIPTKGKYRFRIQYQNEDGEENNAMRADYLVPNIKEYGWSLSQNEAPTDDTLQKQSYAFSLDWNDYGDTATTIGNLMIQEAINCEDRFFEMNFNRVYTVANFIDRWKWGYNRARHLGIKEITDRTCSTTTNRFPVNDGVRNFDFIYFLFNLLITVLSPVFATIIVLLHVAAFLYPIVVRFVNKLVDFINGVVYQICKAINWLTNGNKPEGGCNQEPLKKLPENNPFKRISLPMMSYPDCEACNCEDASLDANVNFNPFANFGISEGNYSQLINSNSLSSFEGLVISPNASEGENNGLRQAVAGYQYLSGSTFGVNNMDPKLTRLPIVEIPNQGSSYKYLGNDVTLSQSLNMANLRARYFEGVNVIRTTVSNTIPNGTQVFPSQSFTDSVLMVVCDPGTLQLLLPGDLISFHDTTKINDPNLTGATLNQFDTTSVTGTTNPNQNVLISKTVSYITTGGTVSSSNLLLKITEDGKAYNFVAGNEYFQVITGGTVTQFSAATNGNSINCLLNKYLFNKTQRVYYANPLAQTYLANPLTAYDLFQDQEIIFMSRGVDPYTQKQNIKYDLSVLFGYGFNQGPVVQGSYYLNIPIKQNSNTIISNNSWRNDYITPESHQVTNNLNTVLYHEPYSFVIQTPFSSFTNNIVKYYNSTDKSRLNSLAWVGDSFDLSQFTSPAGVYSDIACNGTELGKSTIGFQYGSSQSSTQTYTWFYNPTAYAFPNNAQASQYGLTVNCFPTITGIPCNFGIGAGAWENYGTFGPSVVTTTPGVNIGDVFYETYIGPNNPGNVPLTAQFNNTTNEYMWYGMQYQYYDPTTNQLLWDVGVSVQIGLGGTVLDVVVMAGAWQGQLSLCATSPQGHIEGGTLLAGYEPQEVWMPQLQQNRHSRAFSPAYHLDYTPTVQMISQTRLVLRSDRLPTSDIVDVSGNTSFSLHLNNKFLMYKLTDEGDVTVVPKFDMQPTDNTNNLLDFEDDNTGISDAVLGSLTCDQLTLLECYSGSGENFGVKQPCAANFPTNPKKTRVKGGCYYFVQDELFKTIKDDFKYLAEWKARFRFVFGACRGVISHVFQNNWVNGTLYSFSFRKQTIFDSAGNVKKYKFCGTKDPVLIQVTTNQGPIYFDEDRFSFFYRSTPFDYSTGQFIGQLPMKKNLLNNNWEPVGPVYKGMNDRNLFFPTTIMDLGPRDKFAKEICLNPQLEGYLVDTLKSTSYNETSDILLFAILSRLLSTSFAQKIFGAGDASINTLFSRTEDRLDGDIAQMFSINSEYGILPFNDEFYDDNDIYLATNTTDGALIGALFSAITENRIRLTPGTITFGNVTQTVGYPKTQVVPMYKWIKDGNTQPQTILGSEENEWYTSFDANNGYYTAPYQIMSFNTTDYFQSTNGPSTGYIYNYNNNGVPTFAPSVNQTSNRFVVGAPYHFYFGLNKGKSALNRYITKYLV
jgi:hypothetical protein